MQSEVIIPKSKIGPLVDAVFAESQPIVYEANSAICANLQRFEKDALRLDIERRLDGQRGWCYYMIHYPDAKGVVCPRRIELTGKAFATGSFRYTIDGWGLIQLQMEVREPNLISCRFAVNSEARALSWYTTYSDQGDPKLWDWKLVEKNTRRLIRTIKKWA